MRVAEQNSKKPNFFLRDPGFDEILTAASLPDLRNDNATNVFPRNQPFTKPTMKFKSTLFTLTLIGAAAVHGADYLAYGNLGTVVDSIGSTAVGNFGVNPDVRLAQGFKTSATVADRLLGIDLGLAGGVGDNVPLVQLYSNAGSGTAAHPDIALATFTGPSTVVASAIYTFTGFYHMAASTKYWVVVSDANAPSSSFYWVSETSNTYPDEMNSSGFTAVAANSSRQSLDGGVSWTGGNAAMAFDILVPEPSVALLGGLGLLGLLRRRR